MSQEPITPLGGVGRRGRFTLSLARQSRVSATALMAAIAAGRKVSWKETGTALVSYVRRHWRQHADNRYECACLHACQRLKSDHANALLEPYAARNVHYRAFLK